MPKTNICKCGGDRCRYAKPEAMTCGGDNGKGVPCSPRLAARYAFLHERGIMLQDWSTDECVAHYASAIREAADAASEPLATDIRTLLARVPAARVN